MILHYKYKSSGIFFRYERKTVNSQKSRQGEKEKHPLADTDSFQRELLRCYSVAHVG